MKLEDSLQPPVLYTAASGGSPLALRTPGQARPFGEVLAQARQAPTRTVVSGDTMLGIVREQAAQRGINLSGAEAFKQAQQLARDSGIADPARIFPGQKLVLNGLNNRLAALAAPASVQSAAVPAAQVLGRVSSPPSLAAAGEVLAQSAAAVRQGARAYGVSPGVTPVAFRPAAGALATAASASARPAEAAAPRNFLAGPHPVLEQTLDRAVARGFIPAIERGDVYDKIMDLAARHKFRPDDFARMTLMESDGMNPKASNERCHGIIQFCDGSDRGAASAGYAANPRAILGFSVYQQLHLVDKYFSEVGVKSAGGGPGPASLDDLYLAVLMPSARGTPEPHAPLSIPGTQANYLHVGRDRSAPITRQSILEGLQQNAMDRLSSFAQRMRPQAMRDEFLPGQTRVR